MSQNSANSSSIQAIDGLSRVPALDGIRGIAVVMVIANHFLVIKQWENEAWWKVISGGWLGVDLFFVLSGFLITGILLNTREKPHYFSNFYKRRILRIFPLYFTVVFLVYFSLLFFGKITGPLTPFDSSGWYLTFTSNIAIALKNNWTYHSNWLDMNHFWSIAVEEQFYLIWPLLIWLVRPKWLTVSLCAGLIVFAYFARVWSDNVFGQWSMASYLLMPCRIDALAAGALLALLIKARDRILQKHERLMIQLLFFYSGFKIIDFLIYGSGPIKGTFSVIFFACLIYLAVESTGRLNLVQKLCENRVLRHLGKYSFALYIFHHLLKNVFMMLFGNYLLTQWPPLVGQIAYSLLASIIIYTLARLSWAYLEKPFLSLKQKWAPLS